jgi:hypothetical protein
VGRDLKAFLTKTHFFETPIYNPNYHEHPTYIANRLIKGIDSILYGKKDDEYELTEWLHGDIEYIYIIDTQERTLHCYSLPLEYDPVSGGYESGRPIEQNIPDPEG